MTFLPQQEPNNRTFKISSSRIGVLGKGVWLCGEGYEFFDNSPSNEMIMPRTTLTNQGSIDTYGLAISPDGLYAITVHYNSQLPLQLKRTSLLQSWKDATATSMTNLSASYQFYDVCFGPDNLTCFFRDYNGQYMQYITRSSTSQEWKDGAVATIPSTNYNNGMSIAISPDNLALFTAYDNTGPRYWVRSSTSVLWSSGSASMASLEISSGYAIAVHPDNKTVIYHTISGNSFRVIEKQDNWSSFSTPVYFANAPSVAWRSFKFLPNGVEAIACGSGNGLWLVRKGITWVDASFTQLSATGEKIAVGPTGVDWLLGFTGATTNTAISGRGINFGTVIAETGSELTILLKGKIIYTTTGLMPGSHTRDKYGNIVRVAISDKAIMEFDK